MTYHRLTIVGSYKSNFSNIRLPSWRVPTQILDWCGCVLGTLMLLTALVALLLLVLVLILAPALIDPTLGKHYVDPFISWSSRLLWQP